MTRRFSGPAASAALLLVLALAACGGDGDSADATTTTEAEETTTTEADETTTTEAEETSTTESEATTGTTIDTTVENAWAAIAVQFRTDAVGTQHDFDCPANGIVRSIWGTDIYTDDSSVCTAAVHAGAITVEDGGTVTIAVRGPQESYAASERFGVTSFEYPAWPGSFSVET